MGIILYRPEKLLNEHKDCPTGQRKAERPYSSCAFLLSLRLIVAIVAVQMFILCGQWLEFRRPPTRLQTTSLSIKELYPTAGQHSEWNCDYILFHGYIRACALFKHTYPHNRRYFSHIYKVFLDDLQRCHSSLECRWLA